MKKTHRFIIRTALFILVAVLTAHSAAADEKARQIIAKVDAAEKSSSSKLSFAMSIRPADGSAARNFSVLSFENADGDSLVEFTEPRTVRGMRILSKGKNSWVFFPSTGRTRKIGSSSRSGSVQGVGGDFSYDDLGGGSWEDEYEFTVISEGEKEWLLEGKRKSAAAAYDAVKLAVAKDSFMALRSEFSLDTEGGYYKVLEFSDFREWDGKLRAGRMVMKNLKKGSSTEILLKDARFGLALDGGLFDSIRFSQ